METNVKESAASQGAPAVSTGIVIASEAVPADVVMPATLIPAKPKLSLAVHMARQQVDYVSKPELLIFEDLAKPITVVLRQDGVYQIRNNKIGVFVIKQAELTAKSMMVPGFTD